jgi:hypothetical protein
MLYVLFVGCVVSYGKLNKTQRTRLHNAIKQLNVEELTVVKKGIAVCMNTRPNNERKQKLARLSPNFQLPPALPEPILVYSSRNLKSVNADFDDIPFPNVRLPEYQGKEIEFAMDSRIHQIREQMARQNRRQLETEEEACAEWEPHQKKFKLKDVIRRKIGGAATSGGVTDTRSEGVNNTSTVEPCAVVDAAASQKKESDFEAQSADVKLNSDKKINCDESSTVETMGDVLWPNCNLVVVEAMPELVRKEVECAEVETDNFVVDTKVPEMAEGAHVGAYEISVDTAVNDVPKEAKVNDAEPESVQHNLFEFSKTVTTPDGFETSDKFNTVSIDEPFSVPADAFLDSEQAAQVVAGSLLRDTVTERDEYVHQSCQSTQQKTEGRDDEKEQENINNNAESVEMILKCPNEGEPVKLDCPDEKEKSCELEESCPSMESITVDCM